MPVLDPNARMKLIDPLGALQLFTPVRLECRGDLCLGIAMPGHRACHACYSHRHPRLCGRALQLLMHFPLNG